MPLWYIGFEFGIKKRARLQMDFTKVITPLHICDYSRADWKYEKLKEQIIEFQNDLPDTIDVCVQLLSFGNSLVMNVNELGYQNPDMLYFYGTINGNEAQLIQHVSQLIFLLIALRNPILQKNLIGLVFLVID